MPRLARAASWAVLIGNLLDLTTSIIPSPADLSYRPPPRSPLELGVQLLLLVPLAWLLPRHLKRLARAVAAAPVPRAVLVVCGGFIVVELVHVALRLETYPWSPVAMYSNGVQVPPTPVKQRWTYVVLRPEGQDLLSPERESTVLRRYLYDFDYKMAAAVTMHSRSSVVASLIKRQVMAQGFPSPVLVEVAYDIRTGAVLPGPARSIRLPE